MTNLSEMTSIEVSNMQQDAQDALFRELMEQRRDLQAKLFIAQFEIDQLKAERDELNKALELVRAYR